MWLKGRLKDKLSDGLFNYVLNQTVQTRLFGSRSG